MAWEGKALCRTLKALGSSVENRRVSTHSPFLLDNFTQAFFPLQTSFLYVVLSFLKYSLG